MSVIIFSLCFLYQFVPFRDYIDRAGNQILSMARLAKDVLAEIPDQLLSFMKSKGIEPRPAPPASSMPNKPPVNMRIWAPKYILQLYI